MNEKTQRFYNVLKILEEHNLTQELILVGGWCLELYRYHFDDSTFPVVQTQDIDILIKNPYPTIQVDIDQILTEHGFLRDFLPQGYSHYINDDLEIEFLTPAKAGRNDQPIEVKKFNITAQALNFMNIIQKHIQQFSFHEIKILAPNPSVFALVKILVSNRREGAFRIKTEKDRETAIGILNFLHANHPEKLNDISTISSDFSQNLTKEILKVLEASHSELHGVVSELFRC